MNGRFRIRQKTLPPSCKVALHVTVQRDRHQRIDIFLDSWILILVTLYLNCGQSCYHVLWYRDHVEWCLEEAIDPARSSVGPPSRIQANEQ